MSRLEIDSPKRARIVMEGLYKDLERRIESSPPGLCPVDMARAFLRLCHAQTCGKCVPCRIGLGQLDQFITDVLEGRATLETLDTMEQTALSIMDSADCAIGYEAALRSAYYLLKGVNPPVDAFTKVRSQGFNENNGVQEAEFQIDDIKVRTAVVSGLGNTRALLEKIESGEVSYDFVEVMACPGGCVGGGGQPIHDGEERAFLRSKNLYDLDSCADLRFSHENPDILGLYEEFFGEPNSHKAHMLLHTEHTK